MRDVHTRTILNFCASTNAFQPRNQLVEFSKWRERVWKRGAGPFPSLARDSKSLITRWVIWA